MCLQLALNVRDLDAAVDFYSKMFGVEPAKRKPGYANFAIHEPPLKLVLFEDPEAAERLNHLGVEVFDDADVDEARKRIRAGGIQHVNERDATCCHARQNKVWAREPDGLRWEWYRVIEDVDLPAADSDYPIQKDFTRSSSISTKRVSISSSDTSTTNTHPLKPTTLARAASVRARRIGSLGLLGCRRQGERLLRIFVGPT